MAVARVEKMEELASDDGVRMLGLKTRTGRLFAAEEENGIASLDPERPEE
jgi:hypothetical protein